MDDELGWCNACKNYVEDCICHLKTGPAPKDGTYINGYFEVEDPLIEGGAMPLTLPCWWDGMREEWDTPEGYYPDSELHTFAILNTPETPKS